MQAVVDAGTPGVVTVIDDRRGHFAASAGSAYAGTPIEPNPGGRFRIGSISKTFTATLVLQLAGDGRISLDDEISRYLPGLLPYDEPITIRQLLQHTSGLPRTLPLESTWSNLAEVDTERFVHFSPEKVVRLSATQPLLFPPGTGWSYSNTAYTVLGMLVEQVTGQRYEHVLREHVLRPLHLRSTSFERDFPAVPFAAASGYEQLYPQPQPLTDVTTYNLSRFFGAGTMISTGAELNRFFDALLGGELLPPAMLSEMTTTVPVTTPDGEYAGMDYGLGLMRMPLCGGEVVAWGHNGSVPGYVTWSMHTMPASEQITTVATRSVTASPAASQAHLGTMIGEFCVGEPASGDLAERVMRSQRGA